MSRWYSDHFNASGVAPTLASTVGVTLDTTFKAPAGIAHPRLRRKRVHMVIGTAAQVGDEIRWAKFRTSDRIFQITFSALGATAANIDLGFFKAQPGHTGPVVTQALFDANLAVTALSRSDIFASTGTVLGRFDRGKMLWELINTATPGTYTVDPMEEWDLTSVVRTAFTVALNEMEMEIDYTAGD